jgi:hypothetical protein
MSKFTKKGRAAHRRAHLQAAAAGAHAFRIVRCSCGETGVRMLFKIPTTDAAAVCAEKMSAPGVTKPSTLTAPYRCAKCRANLVH